MPQLVCMEEVRRQLLRIESLLPPCGVQRIELRRSLSAAVTSARCAISPIQTPLSLERVLRFYWSLSSCVWEKRVCGGFWR